MDKFNKILSWMKSLPITGRVISLISLFLLAIVLLFFSSCSVMTIRVKGTKDNVRITTTQTRTDSSNVNVSVNPTINIKPIE